MFVKNLCYVQKKKSIYINESDDDMNAIRNEDDRRRKIQVSILLRIVFLVWAWREEFTKPTN